MELLRISELARRAGVPLATVKFYVREGLISATRKTGRTMSWYDPELVTRIRAIKDLQRGHFLPLDVIRETIDSQRDQPDDLAATEAIAKVLARHTGKRARTRAEILARGTPAHELDWLAAAGLARPSGPDQRYSGDDLALLMTLRAARRAGLDAAMLPFDILHEYLGALRALVDVELRMFRDGVIRGARQRAVSRDVGRLTTAATKLSERLVVLIRRKLLLPTLERLLEEDASAQRPAALPGRRPTPRRGKRSGGRERATAAAPIRRGAAPRGSRRR